MKEFKMSDFYFSKTMSFILVVSLFVSSLSFMQAQSTRPRRVDSNETQTIVTPTTTPESKPTQPIQKKDEPLVRIGLATSVRSASVSTTAPALNASTLDESPIPLEAASVRVEVRNLRPLPAGEGTTYQLEILDDDKADAEIIAIDIKEQTGEKTSITQDEKGTFHIAISEAKPSQAEAEELRARLDLLGFDDAKIVVKTGTAQTTDNSNSAASRSSSDKSSNNTKLISNMGAGPLREVAVYKANAKLLGTPAPVSFGSENQSATPVRFNGKSYRGRIEVFANERGSLTVVNVISMEDYVRGVVPNELSPGGYPQIEALKAQAVAARTYALKNKGQFSSQGFDLLPTTRSQVYQGYSSEHALTNRAVAETSGVIATYKGEPITAYYTSTCGGRTEDGENIFKENVPYLRGRECSIEAKAQIAPYTFKTSRDVHISEEGNAARAREAALLLIHGLQMNSLKLSDSWLTSSPSPNEIRALLSYISVKHQQPFPQFSDEVEYPAQFYTALARVIYGESRADVLLDNVDVEYLLPLKDANEIPARNRADVAMFLRDGILSVYADASLRPREKMPRWMMLHSIYRLMEKKNLFQLKQATINQTKDNRIMLRVGKSDTPLNLSTDTFLFRAIGDGIFPTEKVALMGGESVTYHTNSNGQVDFLEVRPSPNGASAERMSPFTNWTKEVSLGTVQASLRRWSKGIGTLTDLKVIRRGYSRRVVDLQLVGTNGTTNIRGGVIRSALRLREQLFVIDRRYNSDGRVVGFVFTGRGWGHGVGMCQVGAYGLAKLGLKYDQILKAYYSGIEMTKMY